MVDKQEIRERLEPYIAKSQSEEGQEKIYDDNTHVSQLHSNCEITYTKSGDLYGKRSQHQSEGPVADEVLDGRYIILDREKVEEILDDYRDGYPEGFRDRDQDVQYELVEAIKQLGDDLEDECESVEETTLMGDGNMAGINIYMEDGTGISRIKIWAGGQFKQWNVKEAYWGPNEVEVKIVSEYQGFGTIKVNTQFDDDRVDGIEVEDGVFKVWESHEMEKGPTVELDLN